MAHKAGFVSITGKPNVGKSTLMNTLLGEELSIATAKAQTTRHRIKGILSTDEYQIIFSDTPGIIKPAYKLQEKMMTAVEETVADADVMMYIVELGENKMDEKFIQNIREKKIPLFLIINKIDLGDQKRVEDAVEHWKKLISPDEIIPVSSLHKFNTETIIQKILNYLPESPAYYDKEGLSDRNVRFFVSEMVREQILLNYQKEIPYSCEVVIDSYKEEEAMDKITATIYVIRESQKGILIGHRGKALKKLGTDARKKIEAFLHKKIFLGLTIKVRANWRDDDQMLNRFGYSTS